MNKWAQALLLATALSGCSLAPKFMVPDVGVPATYKEQPKISADGNWKAAAPLEQADRGQWWKIFGDPLLNDLEQQAAAANPTLAAASARVDAARAAVRASAASFLPQIDLGGNAVRSKPSMAGLAAFGGGTGGTLKPYTLYEAQGVASYEVDLFGRVRNNEKALSADADAAQAAYRSMLLALQADVAQHYFALRALDAERGVLRNTVGIRQEAARIMQKRFDAGDVATSDMARSQAELAATQADLTALDRNRAMLEHALAVLLGKMPAEFSLVEGPLPDAPPQIPAGLPSSLLERRPDIAGAVAAMQAANARIGVARSAYFPLLTLTASGGVSSNKLEDLFKWTSRTWALGQMGGSALAMTLFDSGRTSANVDAAHAEYAQAVANYRAQVLVAFRDVEDTLSDQRLLAEQSVQQDAAAFAATQATELLASRYAAGDLTYFEVVDAQRSSLLAERAALQVKGQRFITTVALIRALGGGWETAAK